MNFRRFAFFFSIVLLASCGGNNQDLERYIESVKARPPTISLEKLPSFIPVPPFSYPEIANRRNPFKNPDNHTAGDRNAPDQNRKKQPLEMFSMDALKFVGILKQGSIIWGLIAQPDGRVVKVRVGDYMGQDYGRILLITDTNIKLEEIVKNQGKWEKQFINLNLTAGSSGVNPNPSQ